MYGLQRYREQAAFDANPVAPSPSPIKKVMFPAYQGAEFTEEECLEALEEFAGWIEVRKLASDEELVEAAAEVLSGGSVIAWFQGRSEFGQRALGSRSILADPRFVCVQ